LEHNGLEIELDMRWVRGANNTFIFIFNLNFWVFLIFCDIYDCVRFYLTNSNNFILFLLTFILQHKKKEIKPQEEEK
jgi:hypothetical protein